VLVRRRNTSKSKRQRRRTEGRLGDRVWDVIN
jgi:ribosomal protein L32